MHLVRRGAGRDPLSFTNDNEDPAGLTLRAALERVSARTLGVVKAIWSGEPIEGLDRAMPPALALILSNLGDEEPLFRARMNRLVDPGILSSLTSELQAGAPTPARHILGAWARHLMLDAIGSTIARESGLPLRLAFEAPDAIGRLEPSDERPAWVIAGDAVATGAWRMAVASGWLVEAYHPTWRWVFAAANAGVEADGLTFAGVRRSRGLIEPLIRRRRGRMATTAGG